MTITPEHKAFWFALVKTDGRNPSHRTLHEFKTREELTTAFNVWVSTQDWFSDYAFECGVDNEGGG